MMGKRGWVWVCCVVGLAAGAWAQDTATKKNGLEDLQSKSVLSDEERGRLKEWITSHVAAIANASGGALAPAAELRAAYTGTEAYKKAFARTTIELIAQSYGRAGLVPATQLIAIAGVFGDMAAHPVLLEALKDKRVGVRTAAAASLSHMRSIIAQAGGTGVSTTLAALAAAGKQETSTVALKSIYRAMDYQSVSPPAPPQANARALLELLDARAGQYAAGKAPAWGAETVAFPLMQRMAGSLGNAEKTRLIEDVGRVLVAAATRYTEKLMDIDDDSASPVDIQLRNITEQLVIDAQALVVGLTKPGSNAPDVVAKMRKLDKTQMKLQLKAWAKVLAAKTGKTFDVDARAGKWTE